MNPELIFTSVLITIVIVSLFIFKDEIKLHVQNLDKDKKTIWKCRWFSLVKDGHYFYIDYGVEHSGVVIVPIVDNTHILFVKNYRFPLKQDSWELPRGFIDKGENFTKAALRELIEETAYKGEDSQCSQLGFIAPDSSILHNSLPVILIHLKNENKTDLKLDPEISEVASVEIKNLHEWMKDKNVIDGITLAAIYKALTNKNLLK